MSYSYSAGFKINEESVASKQKSWWATAEQLSAALRNVRNGVKF
jgi:hypothetical protein